MLEGQNEIRLEYNSGFAPHILRYHPDDELSCATGLLEPKIVTGSLSHVHHQLAFAAPKQPVVLSNTSKIFDHFGDDDIEILLEASVVDPSDLQIFEGYKTHDTKFMNAKFFAGTVRNDPLHRFTPGAQVVGWSYKLPQNLLRVAQPGLGVLESKENISATEAASEFAAVAVAACIIYGITRARRLETFDFRFKGILQSTIQRMCRSIDATVVDPDSETEADFVVTYDAYVGLQVNGRSLDLPRYLNSSDGIDHVGTLWHRIQQEPRRGPIHLPFGLSSFTLADHSKAYSDDSRARTEPYSTTISHATKDAKIDHVPIHIPQRIIFSASAHYILIGGLGGLGRFLCTWMVEHGVKHLNVISRSGLNSAEAKATHSSISNSGATLRVFQADACDREAVRSMLDDIRKQGNIKGVINLAMILGDAPMADMTGEEWDRAMRVKIDSSWLFHEETMQDDLDHFVLFSSIASVCGNRNQGNYNVANTFLNGLAEFRQGMGKPGVSIALGAMSKSSSPTSRVHLFRMPAARVF